MDENSAAIETNHAADHGWKTVSYQKKNRRRAIRPESVSVDESYGTGEVFRSIEEHAEERRRRIVEAQEDNAPIPWDRSGLRVNHDGSDAEVYGDGAAAAAEENGVAQEKKKKEKKPKNPKVTVAEAAAKIDSSDLAAFLADVSASYEGQQDIQLMRFADYFGRAFAKVNSSQFPWVKILKESSVAKMVDVPLSHISEDVYKTSIEWLNHQSVEALAPFVLWSLDNILADLALHQGVVKGSKKVVQKAPSRSQVAIFVVLAMVFRRKPDVLLNLLPTLKENSTYQGQDKFFVIIWLITQVSQGDLVAGLFAWAHILLPMLSSKLYNNPHSRDLILQVVERILSSPKARTILINGAVRKGERVLPPSALDLLIRSTFPAPSARLKSTERFQAVYPTLKDVALAVAPGSKAMKQLTQQIIPFAIRTAGEGIPDLSREASELFLWCVSQNPECCKQWENVYLENLEASVIILKRLSEEFTVYFSKQSNLDPLKAILKSFRLKNEKAMSSGDIAAQSSIKDSEKYCKMLLARVSRVNGCLRSIFLVAVAVAVSASFLSLDLHSLDLKKVITNLDLS